MHQVIVAKIQKKQHPLLKKTLFYFILFFFLVDCVVVCCGVLCCVVVCCVVLCCGVFRHLGYWDVTFCKSYGRYAGKKCIGWEQDKTVQNSIKHVTQERVMHHTPHKSSDWDACISGQVDLKHTNCQNSASTKNCFSPYLCKNIICL
jgi:hypothetical protein